VGSRIVRAEGGLPDPLDELRVAAFADDPDRAIPDRDFESAGAEGAHEHDLLRVLADVDESAASRNALAELAGVDVALRIALAEAEKRRVEAAPSMKSNAQACSITAS
jgi:hypothetical protein